MSQSPPILIYSPGGGVSSPIGSNPPVYSQADVTQLVEGQAYIDVVFGSIQTDDTWVLVACEVENTTDLEPLNIWPGIITDRSTAGFRLQLNGMPDSDNYYLNWAVSGINIEPSIATTYFLTGPSSVTGDELATYTVSLPPSTYVNAPVTVTPAEGGLEIGVFSPETVTLTTNSPSTTFTFTPSIYGDTTITVNNDRNFTDPVDLELSVVVPTYTLEGPSGGDTGVESSDFTVELVGAAIGTVTVTPDDGGSGTFTPTSVALTTLAPSDTFTYTPSGVGINTISVTNDSGLTDPADLTYTVTVAQHLLDTLISYWKLDEAGLARNDSQGTNHLSDFNTVNGAAGKINNCAQFIAASSQYLWCASNASLRVTSDFTFSLWIKMSTVASVQFVLLKQGGGTNDYGLLHDPAVGFAFLVGTVAVASDYAKVGTPASTGTWYHLVLWFDSATGQVYLRVNDTTTYQSTTSPVLVQTTGNFQLGATVGGGNFMDGYLDEVGFWKRKLTALEMTALYNGGAGLPYSSFTT